MGIENKAILFVAVLLAIAGIAALGLITGSIIANTVSMEDPILLEDTVIDPNNIYSATYYGCPTSKRVKASYI